MATGNENAKIDQGFTKEQLEELQIDSALGGDIPFVSIATTLGRKAIPKLLEESKKIFTDVYKHYMGKKAAATAAKEATIAELRASMKPLEDVIKKAVEDGKLDASILKKEYKGGDMFAKNSDQLSRMLSNEDYRNYAKLALKDEEIYRQGLSGPGRFLRAFHYDNANPEVGYLVGPSRYGGTYQSHLKVAAADTELEAGKIAVLSMLRGVGQVVGVSVAAASVAIDHYTDDKNANKKAPAEKVTSDQVLGEALKLSPELRGQADQALTQARNEYNKMGADDKAKAGDETTYMDKAKLSIAKEIATIKLEQHEAHVSTGANQQSNAGNRDLNQQFAVLSKQIDTLPEHQQHTVRSAMAQHLNKQGFHIEETHPQQVKQEELA